MILQLLDIDMPVNNWASTSALTSLRICREDFLLLLSAAVSRRCANMRGVQRRTTSSTDSGKELADEVAGQ